MSKLLDYINECPRSIIVIDSEDLMEFVKEVFEEAKENAVEKNQIEVSKRLLSREEVMEELGVSSTTLWRWGKSGYLKPIHHGSKVMYRESDIEEMRNR